MGIVVLGVVFVALVVLDVLAIAFGADSRPGFGMNRTPDRIFPA